MATVIGSTLQHAQLLSRHLSGCNIRCATVAILMELGISSKRIGYRYLLQAIIRYYEDPSQALTKEIYPAIADARGPGVDGRQVESAIRAVIMEAWDNRNPRVWNYYFKHYSGKKMGRPSNMEFISEIARFLDLCQGCGGEVIYE